MPKIADHIFSSIYPNAKKLILVGGKGGVGKTSISCALAYHLSRNFRTLLISTDPAHSLSDSLGQDPRKGINTCSHERLSFDVWELDAQEAFEEFKKTHHEEIKTYMQTSTNLDEEDIEQAMCLMFPGIDEIMGLKSIVEVVHSDQYEKVVVDTAPTGHALRLIYMPEILNSWIKVMAAIRWKYRLVQKTFKGKYTPDDADDLLLDLKRVVSRMQTLLKSEQNSEFLLVTTAAAMAVKETKRLRDQLIAGGLNVKKLIVNRLMPYTKDAFYRTMAAEQQQILLVIKELFPNEVLIQVPLQKEEVVGLEAIRLLEISFSTIKK